jgi:hypothetical protein
MKQSKEHQRKRFRISLLYEGSETDGMNSRSVDGNLISEKRRGK